MTSVLDSLVLEFGLDPRNFTKNEREVLEELRRFEAAAAASGTRAEEGGKRIVDVMGSFRREALATLGLFLGGRGIKEYIGFMTQLDASTGKQAQMFNMSARELSAWQGVMEQSGGSAESMSSAISGVTQDMNKFMLTGQGTLASVLRPLGISLFDNNKQLKSAGQLFLELADATKSMDPARATAFLSMIPGMNQDSISLILRGRTEMEAMLKTAQELGGTTGESAEEAKKYQQDIANLDRSMNSLGRTVLTTLMPALQGGAKALTDFFHALNTKPDSPEAVETTSSERGKVIQKFGSPRKFINTIGNFFNSVGLFDKKNYGDTVYGPEGADEASEAANTAAGSARASSLRKTSSAAGSTSEMEAYIRQAAVARKIDPDTAVSVAKSEGLFNYVGDRGSSFGPFQLHYGGVAGGGMAVSGLGDEFTKKTGLNARDEGTWRQQVDFSLDKASKSGWGDWHGWKGAQFAGIGGRAGAKGGGGTTVSVGNVNVYTSATDGKGIASDIKPELEKMTFTSQFNDGLQ